MRKFIITSIFCTLIIQTASAQTYIELGSNYATMSFGKSNALLETAPIIGPKLGVTKYWGPKRLKLKTGILFSSKGYGIPLVNGKDRISLYYMDLPINLSLGLTKRLAIEAGPLISVGVLGIQQFNGESEAIEFGKDGLRRVDAGLNVDINYTMSKFRIGMNASHGAISIVESNNDPILNKVGCLYVAYRIGKK